MDSIEDDSSQPESKSPSFTPAERIAELNEIDKVRYLLRALLS